MFEESDVLELKSQYTEDIKKEILAFANTNGGTILIGVGDDGQAIGVEDADDVMLRIASAARDSIKPDIMMFVQIQPELIEGKRIVRIEVQRGSARPYYLAGKGIRPEGVYVRQGSASVPTSAANILKMIKETDGEHFEEMRSVNQQLTFDRAEKDFAAMHLPFGSQQMKTLKLVNEDGMYNQLALLLSDQCQHTIKLAVFQGDNKVVFKDRLEVAGSLFQQLEEASAFLNRYNRVRAEIHGLRRIDHMDYPDVALREALLNSLIHRDYGFSGSILISIFDNRVEFVTIGGLVNGITREDMMLGVSVPRNENLANVFYRLKLIEAYGTGIPKIFDCYCDEPVQPEFLVSDNAFKLVLPNCNFAREQVDTFTEQLSVEEQKVLEALNISGQITRKEVETVIGTSQSSAVLLLKQMVEKNLIRKTGNGKNTRYCAVEARS